MPAKLNFKPATVTKRLVAILPERSRDVIVSRYALSGAKRGETLDAIGKRYGITRERVRQIENHAIKLIQESEVLIREASSLSSLESAIKDLGGVLTERSILEILAPDPETQNHLYFMLVIGKPFVNVKEDKDLKGRWFVDHDLARAVESALKEVHAKVRPSDVLTEDELIEHVKGCVAKLTTKPRSNDTILRWLELSQCLVRNPLGEWGRVTAPGIRVKNIRDYAYLAMKRHGSPMHFREVAKSIRELFGKPAHEATTHNELIKDARFVLVGRGIYALAEWGYRPGPVATIIEYILKKGSMTKEEILKKVKEERWVKDNTVFVNLQNSAKFVKGKDGRYALR